MKIIASAQEIRSTLLNERDQGKTIGFVPTMGSLHQAHLSLARKSVQDNDLTVVSIYVNPTQFGPGEDFEDYPRDLARDVELLQNEGVDYIFAPEENEEIYPGGMKNEIPQLPDFFYIFEGTRPGDFFKGIAQVVSRLFDLVPAHRTYFGQKDYQQTLLIDWLIKTLNFNTKLVVCPIMREPDGLAISSRNIYLNPDQRRAAVILFQTLNLVQQWINSGETRVKRLEQKMKQAVLNEPLADKINYLGIRGRKMEPLTHFTKEAVAFLGVSFGRAKLIDNLILKRE
jgi:pantoate--beta-alanine ligase